MAKIFLRPTAQGEKKKEENMAAADAAVKSLNDRMVDLGMSEEEISTSSDPKVMMRDFNELQSMGETTSCDSELYSDFN